MNNNNNLKDILDFKPKINKEKMSYSREEKDGFRSIAFYSSVNHTPILFSKIDSNTIDLCNGELKIIDIVETIFSSIKGPSWIELINNTVSLIFYLTDLEVINSDSLNPFLTYTTLKLDEEIQILEFCYYQQDKLDYFLEKVFSNNEYYYYHYNPLLNKYDNNIKNLKKELDKRENKILIIKKSIEIVGIIVLKKDINENTFILNNLIVLETILEDIKICKLKEIFSINSLRLRINSLREDERISTIFIPNKKESFILKKELNNNTDINETVMYYF